MDRSQDYNFASNFNGYTNDHYTQPGRLSHNPPYQQSNSSAQASHLTSTRYDHTNKQPAPESQHQTSVPQLRLPSLAPPFGFASDFQFNALLSRATLPPWQTHANASKYTPDPLAYGSGARPLLPPIASLTLPMPLLLPLPVPTSLPHPYARAPQSFLYDRDSPLGLRSSDPLDPSYGQHEHEASTSSLNLADICHIEDPDFSAASDSDSEEHAAMEVDLPMSDEPYSACPATEFSAPSWSPSLYVPSLAYDNVADAESNCMTSPKREYDDFLCFSPTLAAVEEDVFGPAPILGIYADVNMRELAVQEMPPSFCVNPADVMGCCSEESTPEPDCKPLLDDHVLLSTGDSTPAGISRSPTQSPVERQLSHTPGLTADFTDDSSAKSDYTDDISSKSDFPEDAISAIVSVLKSSVKQEQLETVGIVHPCELHAPQPQYPHQAMSNLGNDIGIHHPSLAFNPCSSRTAFPGPRIPFGDLQQQNIQPIQVPQFSAYQSFPLPIGFSAPAKPLSRPPASPVLNAHTGIELEELRQRAAETRMRHPNAELDKSFLQCFAGRLSERGELLDEYRCYVVGCGQRNKRRDHILVHVGSHVEHRPWQCQSCGMRFLRKNECKRHESSHEGRKPFACQICAPYQERNFVRQDLLKRHMRVTHGVNDTSRATASSRKREQARQNEMEGWP